MDYQEFLKSKEWQSRATGLAGVGELNPSMFAFQSDLVRWALQKGRACLFLDCGLGKTFMQLEWANQVPGNVLILAPLAVSGQTRNEGELFGIPCNVSRDGTVNSKITIANYERLHLFNAYEFDGIVLDESSILKSHTGKYRTQIIEAFRDTPFKLCCTATPAPNDTMELANHVEFMGIMKRQEFLATWFTHDGGNTSKWRLKKHAAKLFWGWMATWAVVMRRPGDLGYQDSGFDLPPLAFHEHRIETEIVQEGELFTESAKTMSEQRKARRLTMDMRINEAVRITEHGGPWVVWCELNDESSKLASMIDGAVEVSGKDSMTQKEEKLLSFSLGKIRVLVTKPKIAGHGMNWQHCSRHCFVGLSHSFEQNYQAIRRSWRFGQQCQVDAHVIVTDLESAVVDNVERKREDHERMMSEMVDVMKEKSIEEIHGTQRESEQYKSSIESGENWTIIHGDSVEEMRNLENDSVGLSVFSPPFASLYTYSASDRDMGNCRDYREFMEHFRFIIDELARVMMPGRNICVHCMDLPISKEREGFIGIRDFSGMIIQEFEAKELHLHSRVTIWKDPVVSMQRTKAIGLLWKQIKKDSAMSRMGYPDYVLTFQKPGKNPEPVSHTADEFPVDLWQKWASPVWMDINQSDTLQRESARENDDERHIAPLQLEVIRRCVRLWSNPGDLVMSPFAGIGSEGHVSIQESRNHILIRQ
jgi:DNA modification methylase